MKALYLTRIIAFVGILIPIPVYSMARPYSNPLRLRTRDRQITIHRDDLADEVTGVAKTGLRLTFQKQYWENSGNVQSFNLGGPEALWASTQGDTEARSIRAYLENPQQSGLNFIYSGMLTIQPILSAAVLMFPGEPNRAVRVAGVTIDTRNLQASGLTPRGFAAIATALEYYYLNYRGKRHVYITRPVVGGTEPTNAFWAGYRQSFGPYAGPPPRLSEAPNLWDVLDDVGGGFY